MRSLLARLVAIAVSRCAAKVHARVDASHVDVIVLGVIAHCGSSSLSRELETCLEQEQEYYTNCYVIETE